MTPETAPTKLRSAAGVDITVQQPAGPRRLGHALYGLYAWSMLAAVALPTAIALLCTPELERRRRLARRAARAFLAAIGSRLRIVGAEIGGTAPCIVVANHASYFDGIVLQAALPPRFSFLIKHDMAHMPLAGFMLRRIGSQFVDRGDPRHRHRTARRLVAAAANGDALVVFPEGTFDAAPGLKPFQMGAFLAAWRTQGTVLPAVIHGTRQKLPPGAWLPTPGPVEVCFCPPLPARDYPDARALMAAARAAICAHLEVGAASAATQ